MATGFGFKLYNASTSPQPLMHCIKLAGYGTRVGIGDPVKKVTGSAKIGKGPVRQAVERAASGDRVMGIVVGVEKHSVASGMNLNQRYSPASTAEYLLVRPVVSDDVYAVQEDADGDLVQDTEIGSNANFIAADCSTTTGMSGYMLDSNTTATTNTLDLKIVGFAPAEDNTPEDAAGAIILVKFNKIENVDQATGV